MFTSRASKLSMMKNTEAFLSRFKWILNEEDWEDEEGTETELETGQVNQSLTVKEMDIRIQGEEQELSQETATEKSPSVSPSLSYVPQNRCAMKQESVTISEERRSSDMDLTSFEVVHEGLNLDMCKTKDDSNRPQMQNNGFGDAGDTTMNVYNPENKKSSSVKSILSYFLEENGDGWIPFGGETPNFQRDAIIIGGDILSTAVQGLKAGVSYLLGDQKHYYREDTVHYRGYKLRTKGMELFLDSEHAKNKCRPDEESSVSETKVHFQFKLSNNNRFWQTKELKKIISLPLKVYWLDQINSTSMFVEVFDSEIELEMPIGIPKDSIVVACDPDQGTLSILAPSYPQ